jgi:hypothetical protein
LLTVLPQAGGVRRSTQQLGHFLSWCEPAEGLSGSAVEFGGDVYEQPRQMLGELRAILSRASPPVESLGFRAQ